MLWLKDYLSQRKQFVRIDGESSEMALVPYGVPQGSVLGPVLFSMFIDDLPDAVQSAETLLYADDTTLYCIAETVDAAISRLNRALAELRVWCNSNHLIPHPGKCRAMLMHRGNFTGPVQQLLLGDNIIEWTESERLLGVQVDHKLSWTNHAETVAKAYAVKLNLLRRSQFLPTKQQEYYRDKDSAQQAPL